MSDDESDRNAVEIPKQLRAEWMDKLTNDSNVSSTASRIGCLISSLINRRSGYAYARQVTIARKLGLHSRTVQINTQDLEKRGYLLIERRELGFRKSDNRRVCGGKGFANVYRLALDGKELAGTPAGRRLLERAHRIREDKAARTSILRHSKDNAERRPLTEQRTNLEDAKNESGFVPTLTDPTDQNPSRGRAGARDDAPEHPLGAVALAIRKLRGDQVFAFWFSEVTIISFSNGQLVLGAPSRFIRDWLRDHFADDVRHCWNLTHPTTPLERIGGLEFRVRS